MRRVQSPPFHSKCSTSLRFVFVSELRDKRAFGQAVHGWVTKPSQDPLCAARRPQELRNQIVHRLVDQLVDEHQATPASPRSPWPHTPRPRPPPRGPRALVYADDQARVRHELQRLGGVDEVLKDQAKLAMVGRQYRAVQSRTRRYRAVRCSAMGYAWVRPSRVALSRAERSTSCPCYPTLPAPPPCRPNCPAPWCTTPPRPCARCCGIAVGISRRARSSYHTWFAVLACTPSEHAPPPPPPLPLPPARWPPGLATSARS